MTATRAQVEAKFRRLLLALKALPATDKERHAVLARDAAAAAIDIRERYLLPDGSPDWAGRTWAYRDCLHRLYDEAKYTPQERSATAATLRYHVGNMLRDRLTSVELEAHGVTAPSPRKRQAARRQRASVQRRMASYRNLPETRLALMRDLLTALMNASPPSRQHMCHPDYPEQRREAMELLDAISVALVRVQHTTWPAPPAC